MMTVAFLFINLLIIYNVMEEKFLEQQKCEFEIKMILQYLAPWHEKTDEEESLGSWETTLATRMMMKLLDLWLTKSSRECVESMLLYYHPLDRAAMVYALLVYLITGRKMTLKNGAANQHYRIICKMLKEDMPELFFSGHMRYMMRRYGKRKS